MTREQEISTSRLMDAISALHSIGRDIGSQLDMRSLLQRIIQHAVNLLDAHTGSIFLYDPVEGVLTLAESFGDAPGLEDMKIHPHEGLIGKVFTSGQAYAVDDYPELDGRLPQFSPPDLHAALCVPMRWHDQIIGTLNLGSIVPDRRFSPADLQIAEMFAAQAAVAIGNLRLFESTRRQIDQLDRLRAIALELLSSTDMHSVLQLISRAALEHTSALDVHVYLYDARQDKLQFGASLWADGAVNREFSTPRPSGITMTVAHTGQRFVSTDPHNDLIFRDFVSGPGWDEVQAIVSLPLRWGAEVLGVFNIAFDHKVVVDRDLLQYLDFLTAQAAVAIHNARLFEAVERRADEFERLRAVAVEVLAAQDITTILYRIAQEGVDYAQAQDVRIYLYDQANDRLTFGTSLVEPSGRGQHELRAPRPNGLTATVARTGQRILIDNPKTHPLFAPLVSEWSWEFNTIVGFPIKRGDEVIGVFNAIFEQPVSEETLSFLNLLAAQAAVAIHNARLFANIEQRASEYDRLRAVALELLSTTDVQRMMRTIARAAIEGARATDVHIHLYDPATDTFHYGACLWGPTGDFDRELKPPRRDGLTASVARTGERILITDPDRHPLFAGMPSMHEWGYHTIIGVPLKQAENLVGVMNVFFTDRVSEEVLHFLDLLAAQAVVAFQSARLYEAERSANTRSHAILKAALSLSSKLSLEELLDGVLEECALVLPMTTGAIMMLEDDGPVVVALRGYEGHADGLKRMVHDRLRVSPILQDMLRDREPVIIPDVTIEPRWEAFPGSATLRTWMGIPLLSRGQMIGVLSLDSDRPGAFTEDHAEMARGLAAHAAIAIENARLFDAIQAALAQVEAFFQAGQALITAREPAEMLRAIAGPSLYMGASNAVLFYVDLDAQGKPEYAELVKVIGPGNAARIATEGKRYKMDATALGRLLEEGPYSITLVPDITRHSAVDDAAREILSGTDAQALAMIPMVLGSRLVGVVGVLWSEPHEFSEREIQFFTVVSPQLAAIVENRRLLEKTRSAEERFRDIALSTSDWLWECDVTGRITYCSERIVESLGYTPTDYTGMMLYDIAAPDSLQALRKTLSQSIENQWPIVDLEYWSLHKDGRRVYLSTSAVPVLRRDRLVGYRGVTKDITEQHNAEQRERLAYEVGQRMTSVLSLDDLASAIVMMIQQSFGYYHVHLFLYDTASEMLHVREGTGEAGRLLKQEAFALPLDSRPSLVAQAGRTRRPVISNDARSDQNHLPNPYLPETRAEAAFPLQRGDRLLGVLDVQAAEPERFSPAEVRTLENLAAHASIAIENARLYEAERTARDQATALLEASRALSSTLSLSEMLSTILRQCSLVLPYVSGSILIYENKLPVEVALDGYAPGVAEEFERQVKEEFVNDVMINRAIETRQPITVPDVRLRPDWWLPIRGTEHIRAWLGVPLIAREQFIGILMLNSDRVGAYTTQHVEMAQALATHAALMIENARLYGAIEQEARSLEDLVAERSIEVVRERERLKAIVESAGEGIIFTGPSGELEFVNPAWEHLTGYRALDVLGRPASMVFGSSPTDLLEEMLEVLRSGNVWEGEIHARRPDGSEYDAAVTVAPVIEADGRVGHLVGVFRDITAQKEVDRMRKKFVANVSHELRTPITSIKLFHTLLRSGPPDRRDDYLETMAGEISRLERLVEDLLDISRLDRGVMGMHFMPMSLNELVEEVIHSHQLRAEKRGLTLELDLYAGLPPIRADRERLMQVIVNLLTNAINYTSPGDRIGLRTALVTQHGQPRVTLTMWDTGMGIAPEDLPFIFNRFFRAETAKVEGIPGTGLGLSIVKEIVEAHRGIIRAESTVGEGSTFTVTLPVEELAGWEHR